MDAIGCKGEGPMNKLHPCTATLVALASLTTTAGAADNDADLESVVVTGRAYNELASTSATKTDTPLIDTPQSVQVITERLIEDRRPVTLTEALYNASGVSDGGGRRATFDFPLIRGFDASSDIFLDGLRVERGSTNFSYELLGLERVEVLKGPSSVLFGQGALGGAINEISRRPSRDPSLFVEGTYGSYDFSQLRVDGNGPIGENVSARVNALYRSTDDYIDLMDRQRTFVAPSLRWDISEDTDLTLLGSYTKDKTDGSYIGLPAEGTILPNINGPIPRKRNVREPSFDRLSIERTQVGYALEHRFSDRMRLRQNLRYSNADVLSNLTIALFLDPDQRTLYRGVGEFRNKDQSLAIDTNLEMRFESAGASHTVLLGVDYLNQDVDQSFAFGFQSPIDLYAPAYDIPVDPTFPANPDFNRKDELIGFYAQDQISIGTRLDLVVGLRYDTADTRNRDIANGGTTSQSDGVLVPRIGMVYKLAPDLAAYANYARSFNPNFGVAFSGSSFDPEKGEIFEAGLKSALLGGRVNATLAAYEITRTNVLATDPDPLHAGFSIATGKQRSRGIDADIAYHAGDAWNVGFALAYTDIEITRDTDFAGSRPINVPKLQTSAYTHYDFGNGFGTGFGFRYVGAREGTLPNSYRLPAYTTFDTSLSYRLGKTHVQLNVYNLLDKKYLPSSASIGGIGVLAGEPLTARLSVGYAF